MSFQSFDNLLLFKYKQLGHQYHLIQLHLLIVYIYNLPKNQPSVIQLSDRLTSIDTLTVSDGDDDDDSSSDNDVPPPPPIYRNAPPRPPLHATNSSNNMARPTLMASRTLTFGSCTTQSSRHRRLRQTVSDLKSCITRRQ